MSFELRTLLGWFVPISLLLAQASTWGRIHRAFVSGADLPWSETILVCLCWAGLGFVYVRERQWLAAIAHTPLPIGVLLLWAGGMFDSGPGRPLLMGVCLACSAMSMFVWLISKLHGAIQETASMANRLGAYVATGLFAALGWAAPLAFVRLDLAAAVEVLGAWIGFRLACDRMPEIRDWRAAGVSVPRVVNAVAIFSLLCAATSVFGAVPAIGVSWLLAMVHYGRAFARERAA